MSFAVWNWMKVYARWREKYLEEEEPGFEWPPFKWWGPPGSGAFITPGPEWPTPEKLIKNEKVLVVLAIIALIALASRAD